MQSGPWYSNPSWFALALSVLSFVIAIRVYLIQRHNLRVTLQRGLVQQAVAINDAFVRCKVKGPYAYHSGIPDDRFESFQAKTVLLLNQINMLRDVFDNQRILGSTTVDSYCKWASTIVRPWIEADIELRQSWELMRETHDWQGEEFIGWLETLFPLVSRQRVAPDLSIVTTEPGSSTRRAS